MEPRTIRSSEAVLQYDNQKKSRDRSQKQLLHNDSENGKLKFSASESAALNARSNGQIKHI